MLVSSVKNFNYYNNSFHTPKTSAPLTKNNYAPQISYCYPKQYFISFEGRVDKGLKSFAERNENYMPETLKSHIQTLSEDEIANTTPLEAQYKAFEYLEICETPDDIKAIYPDEPLFQNLKSPKDSKGTRGLIFDINLMQDDIKQTNDTVLPNNEDLTVYLVKKIFLEGKTLSQINDDLHNDLNPVFKKEEKGYVLSSTLRALGVQMPKTEYINSLKYTKEGYADTIADKMHKRYEALSDAQKAAFRDSIIKGKQEKAKDLSKEEIEARKQKAKEAQNKRWQNMSAEEKTEQIQSMMNGSKKHKVIMINAWNKVPDIRDALSRELTSYHISNPVDKIYKTNNHSKIMSEVMIKFWSKNETFAKQIGEAISASYEEYDNAKENGTVDNFENSVYKKRSEIIADFKKKKEDELSTYVQLTALSEMKRTPYCPLDFAVALGNYSAKPIYSNTEVNYDGFKKQHPYAMAEINSSRIKELLNCSSDDTLETLKSLAADFENEDINAVCKNLMDGNLEFEITTKKRSKPAKLKFTRQPNQETINEYYRTYEKTTCEAEKIITAIKQELSSYNIHHPDPVNVATLRNIVKSFGPCANEVVEKTTMGDVVKSTIISRYVDIELNALAKRMFQQGMTKDEFEKILDEAKP